MPDDKVPASIDLSDKQNGTQLIIAAIRDMLNRGQKIPSERALAELLNVKRHQLRKALESLRASGDLEPAPVRRASSTFPQFSEELVRLTNPLEVMELRLIMEPGLARLASLRASTLEISQIKQAASTPANARSGEVDLNFHLAVVRAVRNHLAGEYYKMLRQIGVDSRLSVAGTSSTNTCPKRIAQRDAEHLEVALAIARRDPEAAEAAMRTHLLSVQKQINQRSNAGSFAA